MARPKRCRRIRSIPDSRYFKPIGIPLAVLEEVALSFDEYEAIRLADLQSLYQDQAAEQMGVSRQKRRRRRVNGAKLSPFGRALIKFQDVNMSSFACCVAGSATEC